MQVCTSRQTDNHASTPPLSFLQAGCPSCCPINSIKALKALINTCCFNVFYKDASCGKPSTLESLAKLHLKNFVTVVDIQSDSSLTVHVNLGSCELDDTIPSHLTGITRYFAAQSVEYGLFQFI